MNMSVMLSPAPLCYPQFNPAGYSSPAALQGSYQAGPHGAISVTTAAVEPTPIDRNTPDYLAQLLNDKKLLQVFPNVFQHMEKILDEGTRLTLLTM